MGEAASAAGLAATGRAESVSGEVCVSVTDVFAVYTMPAIAAELRRLAPQIRLRILADNALSDLQRREADIAIRSRRWRSCCASSRRCRTGLPATASCAPRGAFGSSTTIPPTRCPVPSCRIPAEPSTRCSGGKRWFSTGCGDGSTHRGSVSIGRIKGLLSRTRDSTAAKSCDAIRRPVHALRVRASLTRSTGPSGHESAASRFALVGGSGSATSPTAALRGATDGSCSDSRKRRACSECAIASLARSR